MRLTDLNIDIDEAQNDYAAASGKKIVLAVGGICAIADATIDGIVGCGSSKTEYCHSETDITVEVSQFYDSNGGWSIGTRVFRGGIAGTGSDLDMIRYCVAGTINAISSDTSWVGGIVDRKGHSGKCLTITK